MTKVKGKGGRPPNDEVWELDVKIVDNATKLFLLNGYGVTSMEAVAKAAGVSKRTLYHRYENKADLFKIVMYYLVSKISPPKVDELFTGGDLREVLLRLARVILEAVVAPTALAMHRLLVMEGNKFPTLAKTLADEGRRKEALTRISELLNSEVKTGRIKVNDTMFAAEQFLGMLITTPQSRALGLGPKMNEAELEKWGVDTVEFFLKACRAE